MIKTARFKKFLSVRRACATIFSIFSLYAARAEEPSPNPDTPTQIESAVPSPEPEATKPADPLDAASEVQPETPVKKAPERREPPESPKPKPVKKVASPNKAEEEKKKDEEKSKAAVSNQIDDVSLPEISKEYSLNPDIVNANSAASIEGRRIVKGVISQLLIFSGIALVAWTIVGNFRAPKKKKKKKSFSVKGGLKSVKTKKNRRRYKRLRKNERG